MKKIVVAIGILACQQLVAQLPEDALRASWTVPSGTARQQAIGGAMGSLGGEISSNFVNPAGLGFYKTREIVISPGFRLLQDKASYLNTANGGQTASNFNLGTSGLVTSHTTYNGNNSVFSIAVNRTANFNNHVYYKGRNNYSSQSEQYAEEFSRSGYTIDSAIANPNGDVSYGTRSALYTYLVDTTTVNGQQQVISRAQNAGLLDQVNDVRTSGGITEIALNLATSLHDKWYIGGGIGIPIISYTREQHYQESDATGNAHNDFANYTYTEKYTSKGFGLNAKLGLIFRPSNAWRVGLAVHTPSLLGVTDKIHTFMTSDLEDFSKPQQVSSGDLDAAYGPVNSVNYNIYTPWRFIASGSYVFGGGESNVKAQKGFVTADVEYVTTRTAHFKPENTGDGSAPDNYYDAVNAAIKDIYKNYLSLRMGGELKFNTIFARAGAAYYTNPYQDSKELKADKLFLTAGTGYRNAGMFFDLAFVMQFSRDVNFPYLLSDKNNLVSALKETGGTVVLTVGFKF
ncbi:hypothetical protein Q4E93_11465 [Flavitalea sp. BT771]|uniref:hypothetical protein n=1 Tax=Flavitalea sp. BT771 TaxID=3063329 RepID=UPI0026E2BE59|nr:hypothetical protein [Flavitalea sp. BT771]MDO6431211.1 hypothetical protein [Flavitalea sp. BT771]MDV6220118.1 hypothetical protein [Flavitalea sp. BT771]